MGDSSRFDFCPKCGALARDGVCQSCGYQNPDIIKLVEEAKQAQPGQAYQAQAQGQAYQTQGQAYQVQPQGQAYQTQTQGYAEQGQQMYAGTQQGYNQGQPVYTPMNQQPGQTYQAQSQGQAYQAQPQGYAGPYQAYAPIPPAQPSGKNKNKTTIVLCLILGIVLVLVVALILVSIGILQKTSNRGTGSGSVAADENRERKEDMIEDFEEEYEEDTAVSEEGGSENFSTSYSHYSYDVTEDNWEEEGQDESYPYYSGPYNALRDDLSYEISFTQEDYYSEQTDNVYIYVEYPQISSGEVEGREYINAALSYEYEYYLSLFKEKFKPLMKSEEDIFGCIVDSYVTYMDDKVLSVVFKENVFLCLQDDPLFVLNFYCVNFDLETGTLLENTDILHMDEAFAIDFREREREENGDGALTYYTDQEILEMLKDPGYLVMFYTPMGLEVGLNLDDVVVYVTYEDYEEYLNSF